MENGSIATLLKPSKFGAFPESLVAVYISQVLEGLQYLHEQGVIHNDVKGANILTTKEVRSRLEYQPALHSGTHGGESAHAARSAVGCGNAQGIVKLADFGVATKLSEHGRKEFSVVGTPYWMAPEVIEMCGASFASDIWSVGCTVPARANLTRNEAPPAALCSCARLCPALPRAGRRLR